MIFFSGVEVCSVHSTSKQNKSSNSKTDHTQLEGTINGCLTMHRSKWLEDI